MKRPFGVYPFFTRRRGVAACVTAVALLAAGGCAVHRTIQSEYQPVVAPDLARLKPVTVHLQVTDSRPSDERDNIGRVNKVIYVLDQEPPNALFAAIKAGLEKNGHHVEANSSAPVDIALNVDLTRFYYAVRPGSSLTIEETSTVQMDVDARRMKGEPLERQFSVTGTNQKKYVFVGIGTPTGTTNGALADSVDQMLNDQRLLEVVSMR